MSCRERERELEMELATVKIKSNLLRGCALSFPHTHAHKKMTNHYKVSLMAILFLFSVNLFIVFVIRLLSSLKV